MAPFNNSWSSPIYRQSVFTDLLTDIERLEDSFVNRQSSELKNVDDFDGDKQQTLANIAGYAEQYLQKVKQTQIGEHVARSLQKSGQGTDDGSEDEATMKAEKGYEDLKHGLKLVKDLAMQIASDLLRRPFSDKTSDLTQAIKRIKKLARKQVERLKETKEEPRSSPSVDLRPETPGDGLPTGLLEVDEDASHTELMAFDGMGEKSNGQVEAYGLEDISIVKKVHRERDQTGQR